jgi:hypothetical protein
MTPGSRAVRRMMKVAPAFAAFVSVIALFPLGPADASPAGAITRFEVIDRISPAFGGKSFGPSGPYELIVGRAYGELDPASPDNGQIAELDKAPRNAAGKVTYSTQVAILRPIDLHRGSGRLFFEVVNRSFGTIDLSGRLPRAPLNMLPTFLARGDILVAAAWQGEVRPGASPQGSRASSGSVFGGSPLYADLPPALTAGKPVVRRIRQSMSLYDAPETLDLAAVHLLYPAATKAIEVYARGYEAQPPVRVDADRVHLIDPSTVRIDPRPGEILYDIVYDATGAMVSGVGFAIPRDLVSFLRNDPGDGRLRLNPLADDNGALSIAHAYAYGLSQSGRYLRYFLWQGFNRDTAGRRVFDGIMPVIAGGRRGSLNELFATPGVTPGPHAGHRTAEAFPFAYPVLHDPISGKTDGLLGRCTATDTCPKVMQIDSENELLNAYGYLLTTRPDGRGPAPQPDNVRLYAVAGSDHTPGSARLRPGLPYCTNAAGALTPPVTPFMRALLWALDDWVSKGVAPPASRYPSLADGGLVSMAEGRRLWPTVPGHPFDASRNRAEDWDRSLPLPRSRGRYPLLTVRTDADGNAIDGVRHPMIEVPTATIVGHAGRKPGYVPQDSCPLMGASIPFAATRAERLASGDPRPSLEERYPGGAAELVAKRRVVADHLVAERLLLPEDAASAAAGTLDEAAKAD